MIIHSYKRKVGLMMKNVKIKMIIISLIVVLLTMMVLSGCGIVKVNPDKDRAEIVAKVNNQNITKGEVMDIYNNQKASYGITDAIEKDVQYKENLLQLKTSILDSIIEQAIVEQTAKAKGLALTAAEKKTASDEAKSAIEEVRKQMVEQYKEEAKSDKTIDPVKKANEELNKLMVQQGLTELKLITQYTDSKLNQKLMSMVTKDIKITDADVQKYYDDTLATQKATYAKTPAQFETDTTNSLTILYQPAGFIRVKHILIKIPDDIKAKIDKLETDKKTAEAKTEREKALANIKLKAQSVLTEVQANKDNFDKIMQVAGEDPGMKSAPGSVSGYLLNKDSAYVQEFKDAALKLANVGDITDLVPSVYGYHIIRLVEKVKEGPTALDSKLKLSLQTKLNSDKQQAAWTKAIGEWKAKAKIQKFPTRL